MHDRHSTWGLYQRVAGVLLIITLAWGLGWWAGERSLPFGKDANKKAKKAAPTANTGAAEAPPLFMFVSMPGGPAQQAVVDEIKLASDAGLHQYFVQIALPWEGNLEASVQPLQMLKQTDPLGKFFISVTLDPPPAWLKANPGEILKITGKEPAYASLVSETWRKDAQSALMAVVSFVRTSAFAGDVMGYMIGALEGGAWYRQGGYDLSDSNLNSFRAWLKQRYPDDAKLQAAWGNPALTLAAAGIPEPIPGDAPRNEFLDGPADQAHVDYLRYASQTAADTILFFARFIKSTAGPDVPVIAPYGFSYELAGGETGHFALGRLLDSEIDGFAGPFSNLDRGPGGVGGVVSPIDSIQAHGKKWYALDDTRTGLAWDAATGQVVRPKNLAPEDGYSVQARNFAAAATRRVGLVWSDAKGEGALRDSEMWQRFKRMYGVYQQLQATESERMAGDFTSALPWMTVVVDEEARFHQDPGRSLNQTLLAGGRDAALCSGMPTRFCLLQDVLDGRVPPSALYLFLNAFSLTPEQRESLHKTLAQSKATAIWMYAPGYFAGETGSVDNVSATTAMAVKRLDGVSQSGSSVTLPGRWVDKGDGIGESFAANPLFYVDSDACAADTLATYRASGKPSVAVKSLEQGWTSIFWAEPSLNAAMLREVLTIFEQNTCFEPGDSSSRFCDAMSMAPGLMALHARTAGERAILLGDLCDVQDLLQSEIGWPRRRSLGLPMKSGDTRLLRITRSPDADSGGDEDTQ